MPEDMSDRVPEDMPDRMPEDLPDRMPEDMPEDMPDHMPEDMPDRMPNRMSEDMSDRMPEDLPVRKCINVMVGITRSKVIYDISQPSNNLVLVTLPPYLSIFHQIIFICHVPRIPQSLPQSSAERRGVRLSGCEDERACGSFWQSWCRGKACKQCPSRLVPEVGEDGP